jgi:hypothetical protein
MRRRMIVGVMGVLTASALVIGMSATAGGASVGGQAPPKAANCAGKTKSKAIKQIKLAYDHFLNGADFPDAVTDKMPFLQFMDGAEQSAAFRAQFEAGSSANAAQAATTAVQVNKVKCTGKKTADVDFDLVIGGEPLADLAPPGDAVVEDGVWKVSGQTLCNTQALGSPELLEAGPCYEILLEGEPADLAEA